MSQKVALLVFACDRYELLYKGFDYFFKTYWDQTVPIKKYFATENNDLKIAGYTHLKSGNGEWTNRLKVVLNQIEEDYIIFFQEDMWLNKAPQPGALAQIIDFVTANKIQLLKLHSAEFYATQPQPQNFEGLLLSKLIKAKSKYLMSHQVSIWQKDFLIQQLKDNENPWRNERRGSQRLKRSKAEIYQLDFLAENSKAPINKNTAGCIQGDYQTISVNACLHPKVTWFLAEIAPAEPEYAAQLKSNLENEITHDGKAKPRKEDAFKAFRKKIKRLFSS